MGRKSTGRKLRRQAERKQDKNKPQSISVYEILTGMTGEEFWRLEAELEEQSKAKGSIKTQVA